MRGASRSPHFLVRLLFLSERQARQSLRVFRLHSAQVVRIKPQCLHDSWSNLACFHLIYKRRCFVFRIRNDQQNVTVVVSEAAMLGDFLLASRVNDANIRRHVNGCLGSPGDFLPTGYSSASSRSGFTNGAAAVSLAGVVVITTTLINTKSDPMKVLAPTTSPPRK